jgi:hypothetical protein
MLKQHHGRARILRAAQEFFRITYNFEWKYIYYKDKVIALELAQALTIITNEPWEVIRSNRIGIWFVVPSRELEER